MNRPDGAGRAQAVAVLPAAPGEASVYQGLCGKLWPVGVKP
jgi:hypothetical protein